MKRYISARVVELFGLYEQLEGGGAADTAVRYLAKHYANPTPATTSRNMVLTPYYGFSRYLYDLDDKASAKTLLLSLEANGSPPQPDAGIDWAAEEREAVAEAAAMTSNNDFGMLDDYYTTYIGTRLSRQENKDADLDYSVSKEYGDLRILFEICRQKGIEPLFVHVPLHGEWSDYTGFSRDRRGEYYGNVRDIAEEYGVELLDLTDYEYDDYFLCDVMHLGWRGWLEVDRALIRYFHGD